MTEINKSNEQIHNDNTLNVRTLTSTPYILDGIINKLYVLIEIEAKKQEITDEERNPLELSVVLDRSGSMHGEKLENSKKAMKQMIDNLHNDDVLHLIQYDDKVQKVFDNANLKHRNQLKRLVDRIESGGSTNLMGGVLEGFNTISTTNENTRTKRIFLFSDGLVNVGVKEPQKIYNNIKAMREKGVNVSSFGIGTDFDEDLMTAIAEVGGGDYFFIDGADTIPEIVEEGLGGLLDVVASNVLLKVRGKSGATVTALVGYDLRQGADLGDVRAEEKRQFLAELEVKPETYPENIADIMEVEISYNPIEDLTNSNTLKGSVSISKTENEELITQEEEEVMVVRSLLEAAEREKEILKALEESDFDRALTIGKEIGKDLDDLKANTSDVLRKQAIDEKILLINQSIKRTERAKSSGSHSDHLMSMKTQKYSHYQTTTSRKRKFRDKDDKN